MEDYLPTNLDDSKRHPMIKDFAMPRVTIKDNEQSSDTKKHTCSITFDAPLDVNEHKMMDYIMGIQDALGAKVVKFSWSLSEDKKS
jgi:hypothetical protein